MVSPRNFIAGAVAGGALLLGGAAPALAATVSTDGATSRRASWPSGSGASGR